MKNIELKTTGIRAMSQEEILKTNGGAPWFLPIVAGAAIAQIFMHWDHFKAGLGGTPELVENETPRRPSYF